MIDPKTLHIGSHVLVDGVRARATDIESNYDWSGDTLLRFYAVIDGEKRTCGAFSQKNGVEPIPITAELLTELGFEMREDYWRKIFNPNQWIYIRKDDDEDYYNARIHSDINMNTSFRCKYLHELESFLYLTTKTELIKD